MTINFESSIKKQYVEILPTLAITWGFGGGIYIGFIFWSVFIDFKKILKNK